MGNSPSTIILSLRDEKKNAIRLLDRVLTPRRPSRQAILDESDDKPHSNAACALQADSAKNHEDQSQIRSDAGDSKTF